MDAAVPARALALSRQRLAAGRRLLAAATVGRDAVELLRRLHRRGHHAGRRGRVLDASAIGTDSRRQRQLGVTVASLLVIAGCGIAYASYAAGRRRGRPRRLRVPSRRSVSATARSGGAIWFRPSNIRCLARARIGCGVRWASARGCSSSRSASAGGSSRSASSPFCRWALSRIAQLGRRTRARSGPRHRRRRRTRVLAVARADDLGRSPSSGLQRFCTPSRRCSARTRGSASSCSSWRRCWRVSDVEYLRRAGTRRARIACVALVALAAARVRRRAVGALARRPSDGGAPVGRGTGRASPGPRLRATQSGVSVGSVADWRSHDAAGRRDRRLRRTELVAEARRRSATRICSFGATAPTPSGSRVTRRPTACVPSRASLTGRCSPSRRSRRRYSRAR